MFEYCGFGSYAPVYEDETMTKKLLSVVSALVLVVALLGGSFCWVRRIFSALRYKLSLKRTARR